MSKDKNLVKIKELVRTIFPDSRVVLFGSRTRGDSDNLSDYDILVIVRENLSAKEKHEYESKIRKELVKIPLDVIVKTEEDVNYYKDKIGNITREAITEGMVL